MAKIDSAFFDIGTLDTLACRDSAIHRLDPRAKLVTTLVFILVVVSFDRYAISALLPFGLFPLSLIILADLPPGYLLKKLLLAAPFALCVGIFNPFFDRQTLLQFGPLAVSGGWVSFASILLRFTLTVLAALVLIPRSSPCSCSSSTATCLSSSMRHSASSVRTPCALSAAGARG
jgi:cobalt/nickel transport system permease protein